MRIVSVGHGSVPGLGVVSIDLPTGLVAVVGGDGRVRRLAHHLVAGRMDGTRRVTAPVVADPVLTRLPEDLQAILENGGDADRPESVVGAAARTLALLDGLDKIEAARARLARLRGVDGSPTRPGPEPEAILARIRELESAPEELEALESELRGLREDDAEVTGDLEVANMEWLRERQDAETHLQTYRDRARELKRRLGEVNDKGESATCPTCQRPLADHFDTVRDFLRDEYEDVVQDGSWWRRRREQLELIPERLQELQGKALRLHAATENLAEKVEVTRTRERELEEMRERLAELAGTEKVLTSPRPAGSQEAANVPPETWAQVDKTLADAGRQLRREARGRLLDRIGRILGRITAGRILSVGWSESGQLELGGVEGPLHPPAEEDGAAAMIAARIAFAHAVAQRIGSVAPPLVLADPFDRMEEAVSVRTVELLRSMIGPIFEQVILITRGEIVDVCPEACDAILELRRDAVAGPSFFRRVPAGLGTIRLTAPRAAD